MPYPKTLMLSPKTLLLPNPCPQDVIFLCLLGNPGCYYAPCLPQTAQSEFGHPQPHCSQWFAPIHVQMCPNEQIAHLQKRNLLYVAIDPTLYSTMPVVRHIPSMTILSPPKLTMSQIIQALLTRTNAPLSKPRTPWHTKFKTTLST